LKRPANSRGVDVQQGRARGLPAVHAKNIGEISPAVRGCIAPDAAPVAGIRTGAPEGEEGPHRA
jgi:hypothetical protein